MPRTRTILTAVAASAVAGALAPAGASAATVQVESGRVVLRAPANETNKVTVSRFFGLVSVKDDAAQLFVGPGCSLSKTGFAHCRNASSARLELGPGNDTAISGIAADVSGGSGNDIVTGSVGADRISGGPGTDTVSYAGRAARVRVDIDGVADDGESGEGDRVATDIENVVGTSHDDLLIGSTSKNLLQGGPGRDQLFGREGFDTLDGGAGADVLSGGTGIDTVTYAARTAPVDVFLGDGLANDGEVREGDNVIETEKAVGGRGNDRLHGDAGANILEGGAGNDRLAGFDGDDLLRGGDGSDQLNGNIGSDTLDGQAGADDLFGGTGTGRDRVIYPRLNPVAVTIDDAANDGEFAEGDNVRTDNEVVEGSIAGDSLTGSDRGETLLGGLGNDTLDGGGGADVLDGSVGEDTLRARDGVRDQVDCGSGAQDVAVIDVSLEVPVGCENLA